MHAMSPHVRTSLVFAACLALTFGTGYVVSRVVSAPPGETLLGLGMLTAYDDAVQVSEELDAQLDDIRRVYPVKMRTCDDLISGRISLVEAAAVFHHVMEHVEGEKALKEGLYPGRTLLECRCQEVMAWVRADLKRRPEPAAPVLARLAAELQEVRARTDWDSGESPRP
jgi:hypothetical protein